MECIKCENCKSGSSTYFCLMRNDFVVREEMCILVNEKSRSGWKKGDPSYETHRRKTRKEVEEKLWGIEYFLSLLLYSYSQKVYLFSKFIYSRDYMVRKTQ